MNKPDKFERENVATKRVMFANFAKGLTSDDIPMESKMYFAMFAYETYGDATRDNDFSDLVELGRELEEEGGDQ